MLQLHSFYLVSNHFMMKIPSMHLSTISALTMKLQRGERTKDLQKHTSQPM